ncbi:hypothetical protein OG885_02020 [Streptomyces sp. NBC_00028]|uniref:hypothetical protein n=1 Tax=Streptomyces sp. NBC_00028 TaxID=2975624 RepID=UPI003255FBE3
MTTAVSVVVPDAEATGEEVDTPVGTTPSLIRPAAVPVCVMTSTCSGPGTPVTRRRTTVSSLSPSVWATWMSLPLDAESAVATGLAVNSRATAHSRLARAVRTRRRRGGTVLVRTGMAFMVRPN